MADVESKVISANDAKKLVEMYNEDIRVKQVYEDFDFDHENQMVLKQREN